MIFKSMSRETPKPTGSPFYDMIKGAHVGHNTIPCPECGDTLREGDWPWCKGVKGGHDR